MDFYNRQNELYHHGVLGMKWGVRRSQAQLSNSARSKSDTDGWSSDAKEALQIKKKSVRQMSNDELKKYTTRMNLEQQYSKLNPSTVKKGLAVAAATAGAMGTVAALYNNSNALIKIGKTILGK